MARRSPSGTIHPTPRDMTTTTIALILALLMLPLVVLLWATETTEERAVRLRRSGWSQRRIAKHMGISRSRVQRLTMAA
jgi:DNA-binding NarL/FixJ family response regulator